MDKFELVSEYKPSGDQPAAVENLVNGVNWGLREQTLLGVTGSGKTFTMASVIEKLNRPTLVLAHNKTLAAQLCSEFREFFPNNAVEYFISYYDYYQPEAYIAHTDTYIEKDAAINEEIDRLRHSATAALFERRDVIVVSSVSCLYGLGDPIAYKSMVVSLRVGQEYPLEGVLKKLTEIRYERNDLDFSRNKFRLRGDTLEIYPAYWSGKAIRVEFFGDEVDRISEINAVSGMAERYVDHIAIYPASHYVASKEKLQRAQMKRLIQDLLNVIQETRKYMLDEEKILLDPEYIFCEKDHFLFSYYPSCDLDAREEFHKLTEFFVREVDYQDKEGVHLAYTLHKATMEEHFSIEKIMEEVEHEETLPQIHYVDKLEKPTEEELVVAEKSDFWEPIRRLLERKKKDKWGYWDDTFVEEEDL